MYVYIYIHVQSIYIYTYILYIYIYIYGKNIFQTMKQIGHQYVTNVSSHCLHATRNARGQAAVVGTGEATRSCDDGDHNNLGENHEADMVLTFIILTYIIVNRSTSTLCSKYE